MLAGGTVVVDSSPGATSLRNVRGNRQNTSQETKRNHALQHIIDVHTQKAGKMNPVESPPPSAILTQAKILQRPPQAPKRKQRPSNKNNGSGGDNVCAFCMDHDDDDLDMPHLAAQTRRKLFVDDEPTTTSTMSTNTNTNTTPFLPASDPYKKRFRPIQPDRENERRQVQQEDRLSPSRREERAG